MSGNTPTTPHASFGQVLRMHRLAAGLSQEQLGLESGVQRNFISLIETGQNQPTITTIFKLAAALNIKPSQLVSDTEAVLASQ
jgi:transcriptional regulator with XRE-family HTH domain